MFLIYSVYKLDQDPSNTYRMNNPRQKRYQNYVAKIYKDNEGFAYH